MLAKYKPGPGWRQLYGPVWERGQTRIHMLGGIRLTGGRHVWAHEWPNSPRFNRLVRICGGSNRRALMVMANELEQEAKGGA